MAIVAVALAAEHTSHCAVYNFAVGAWQYSACMKCSSNAKWIASDVAVHARQVVP